MAASTRSRAALVGTGSCLVVARRAERELEADTRLGRGISQVAPDPRRLVELLGVPRRHRRARATRSSSDSARAGPVAADAGRGRRLRRALGGAARRSPRASATQPARAARARGSSRAGKRSARSTSLVAASGSSATRHAREPGERRDERLQIAGGLAVRDRLLEGGRGRAPTRRAVRYTSPSFSAGTRPCASRAAGRDPSPPRGRRPPRRGARAARAPRRGSSARAPGNAAKPARSASRRARSSSATASSYEHSSRCREPRFVRTRISWSTSPACCA